MNNFEYKIAKKFNVLFDEIQKVDSIYLLNLINQKLMHSIQPDPSDLPDGFVQQFNFLCGVIASRPHIKIPPYQDDKECISRIFETTDEIFREYTYLWMSRPSLDGSKDDKKVKEYSAGLVSFIAALHQPQLGSTEQFIQRTLEQFAEFDHLFFSNYEITTQQILDISQEIVNIVRDKYQAVIDDYAKIVRPIRDSWKEWQSGRISLDAAKQQAQEKPIDDSKLRKNEEMFLDSFSFFSSDLRGKFRDVQVNSYLDFFSFIPGSINVNFRFPTDFNEVNIKPIMKIENDRFYCLEAVRLFHKVPDVLEDLITHSQYSNKFYMHRDRLTQDKAVEYLKSVFSSKDFFENAYYGYQNSREYETDLLIAVGKTLLICEVKAKPLRNPLHTEGNIQKIKSDFKESIQKGYDQAVRTLKYIKSSQNPRFVDRKGKLLFEFSRDDFDEYKMVIITQESFEALATDLSFLLFKEEADEYPLVISLFDLELLITRIDSPKLFLEYIRQRVKLHGLVFSHDELDYAGYYLKYGNLDFSKQRNSGVDGLIVLGPEFARIFDLDWFAEHGFDVETDEEDDGPFFTIMRRDGNKVEIGVEGKPESFRTITIGGSE